MKRIIVLSLITVSAFAFGCSTAPICATSSVMPLEGKTIASNLGKMKGSDTAVTILGLYMIGRPDIDSAISDAVKGKDADTLINVRCYEKSSYFILFGLNTVIVEGEAVKFSADKPVPAKGGNR